MKTIFLFLLIFSFNACIKKESSQKSVSTKSPEEVVQDFVKQSASCMEVADKKKLQQITSNELRRTFERMNESAFRMIYLDAKITILDFKILDKTISDKTAKIHYQVTIDNQQGTDPTREVNEREVDLVKTDEGWLIDAIRTKGTDHIAFTRGMLF